MSDQKNLQTISDQRFRASERLKSKLAIDALFKGAETVKAYPLRLVYKLHDDEPEPGQPFAKIGFVASKRNFKLAVDRNHVKRRMREAYRLHKNDLYHWLAHQPATLEGMLIFTARDLPSQAQITKAWKKVLRRLDPDFFT